MEIIVADNYQQMSQIASKIVIEQIKQKDDSILGLATGSTPIGLYKLLIEAFKQGEISFSKIVTYNLDEYVGLPSTHSQSYHTFMRENLFEHIDINPSNTHIPCGDATDTDAECLRYNSLLPQIDLQILGIGSDGHIGFNEPNTPFNSVTSVVELTQSTIIDNSRLFDDATQVPKRAITMGISNIMSAKTIIMLASGQNKAQAVYDMCKGKVDVRCPASILQTHPNAIVILDKQSAKLLWGI